MSCYIFYTHNTFRNYHVSMALESIEKQEGCFSFDEFVVYNNSTDIQTSYILDRFYHYNLQDKFKKVTVLNSLPETSSVPVDLTYQRDNITGHSWYLLHKGDFYLPRHFLAELCSNPPSNSKEPHYLNFCKFDLRETATTELIREMSEFNSFEDLAAQKYANHTDDPRLKYPIDLSIEHIAIGYRGKNQKFDGVMHCYNELAREKIDFSSYWKQEHIMKNRSNNVIMEIDKSKYFVLHMFHDIGRTDKMKQTPGHRF